MKIIFLDLDWVLKKIPNIKEIRKSRSEKGWFDFLYELDKDLVNNLKYLIYKTNSKIVISSSWRHNMERVYKSFTDLWFDLDFIIWKTPSDLNYWRWHEVLTYVMDNIKNSCMFEDIIENFVMIDDDDFDSKCVKRLWRFVHTNPREWLTMKKVEEAILILNDN